MIKYIKKITCVLLSMIMLLLSLSVLASAKNESLKSIVITELPRTKYVDPVNGDVSYSGLKRTFTVDLTAKGMKVLVTYSDGSTETIEFKDNEHYALSAKYPSQKMTVSLSGSTVTVSYMGSTAEYEIDIQRANFIIAPILYALKWLIVTAGLYDYFF